MGDYFHFTCNCLACTQNYPLYSQLDKTFDNEEYFSLTGAAQNAFSTQDYIKGSVTSVVGLSQLEVDL